MQFLQQIFQQLYQLYMSMSVGRRVGVAAVGVLTLGLIIVLGYWGSQPEYRVLFSQLAPEDAGSITSKLQTQGVPFRLADNGTTILVPAERVQQARVDLALEGLPSRSGKGFDELFDKSTLGLTPGVMDINYTRALQAELTRTIMQLEPVSAARVHISRPQPTPFVRQQKPATASVMLKLKPGAQLSKSMSAGIVALVARSIEGMTPENVTIVDSSGKLLSEPLQQGGSGLTASHLDYKRDYENYLASKAEEMLGQVLGPGRALVRVTADINLRSQTEKVETYNLEQRPVKKEEITNEKSNTGGSKGFAGVASNTGAKPATGGNETNRQMETQRTEYFDPPRSEVTRVEAAGSVERQTIAAMVDLSPQGDNPAPNVGIKDVEEIIKQAVGYKAGRDEIKVSEAKIPVAADLGKLDPEVLDMQRWQAYGNIARNASLGVGAMVAMLLGWLTLRRLQKSEAGTGNNLRLQVAQDHERRVIAFRVAAEQNPELLANVLTRWLERDQMPTQSATAAQTERLAA